MINTYRRNVNCMLLLVLITLFACKKDDDNTFPPFPRLSDLDVPVVTGYIQRDINNMIVRTIGEPNVKSQSGDEYASYYFNVYPNPVAGQFRFDLTIPTGGINREAKFWITPANVDYTLPGFGTDLNNAVVMHAGGSPVLGYTFFTNQEFYGNSIDVSNLREGFYRVYLQIGDVLLYDNIKIEKPTDIRL